MDWGVWQVWGSNILFVIQLRLLFWSLQLHSSIHSVQLLAQLKTETVNQLSFNYYLSLSWQTLTIWKTSRLTISFSCLKAESCLSLAALHSDCCWMRSKWNRTMAFRWATSLASSRYFVESPLVLKLVWYMWSVSQGKPPYWIALSSAGDWDLKLSFVLLLFLLAGGLLLVLLKLVSEWWTTVVAVDGTVCPTEPTDSAIIFKSDAAPRISSIPYTIATFQNIKKQRQNADISNNVTNFEGKNRSHCVRASRLFRHHLWATWTTICDLFLKKEEAQQMKSFRYIFNQIWKR